MTHIALRNLRNAMCVLCEIGRRESTPYYPRVNALLSWNPEEGWTLEVDWSDYEPAAFELAEANQRVQRAD